MRLERVIAKDSRRATEQVIATYGPDALIVSNQRVNGMTEIVVAVDTEIDETQASPAAAPPSSEDNPFAPWSKTAFSRSLQQSLKQPSDDQAPADGTGASDQTTEPASAIPAFLRTEPASAIRPDAERSPRAPTPVAATEDLEPPPAHVRISPRQAGQTKTVSASKVTALAAVSPASAQASSVVSAGMDDETPEETVSGPGLDGAEGASPIDSIRARELVDLVRAELASMRKEIALSRQVETFQPGGALPAALQPLAGALITAGAPVGLRSLLLDQVRETEDVSQAAAQMKRHLCATIRQLEKADQLEGIHVLAGPSGGGKTQMACRLAARHVAANGSGSVALISFADNRIGAWTQLQMLAARMGVDCFRVNDPDLLAPMVSELDSRKLILIDTPSAGFADRLATLKARVSKARFHLVIPAESAGSNIARFIPDAPVSWQSVMVSKLDEATQPWALIQALCNHPVPLSVASTDAAPETAPVPLTAARLVDLAFEHLELPVKAEAPARKPRAAARKTVRDLRHAA